MANEEKEECLVCMKSISPDCMSLCCSECANSYHAGKCSGVTRSALKNMPDSDANSWICNTCKTHSKRQSGSSDKEVGLAALSAQMSDMNRKLLGVLNKIEGIEKTLGSQVIQSNSMMGKLEAQGKTVDNIEKSMTMLSEKYDDLLKKVDDHNRTLVELSKRTQVLEERLKEREQDIVELRAVTDDLEQYSRRSNVEIHGVAKKDNENLMEVVKHLAQKLQLPEPAASDIEAVHRLSAAEGKVPPILIRFKERSKRDQWIQKKMALRSDGVFINENLTKRLRTLFWKARSQAKQKGHKFVWMRNGKILVRRREGAAVIRIEHDGDLDKIK